jgi:nitroreductase
MRRLDAGRPVSEADLQTIIEAALKAATGSNSQTTRWIVVTDSGLRNRLGAVYQQCWVQAAEFLASPEYALDDRIFRSASHLGEHMGEAPVIVVPCAPGPPGVASASVFPGVQNLMLAARALGLGTTLTTLYAMRESEVKEILDIPEDHSTYAMIPIGYPLGRWAEAVRKPTAELVFHDRWGSVFGSQNSDT